MKKKTLVTSASKTPLTSFSRVDNNDFLKLGSFESCHYKLSDRISRLDVKMSVNTVVHNYNFKVTPIIQIDNTSSSVSIFDS